MLDKTRVDSDGNWLAIVDAANSGEILEGKIRKDSAIEVDCVDGETVLRNK